MRRRRFGRTRSKSVLHGYEKEERTLKRHRKEVNLLAGISVRDGESYESFMRRFRRACEKAAVLRDYKRHQFYEKPSEKRKRKTIEARRRAWRRRQKEQY